MGAACCGPSVEVPLAAVDRDLPTAGLPRAAGLLPVGLPLVVVVLSAANCSALSPALLRVLTILVIQERVLIELF